MTQGGRQEAFTNLKGRMVGLALKRRGGYGRRAWSVFALKKTASSFRKGSLRVLSSFFAGRGGGERRLAQGEGKRGGFGGFVVMDLTENSKANLHLRASLVSSAAETKVSEGKGNHEPLGLIPGGYPGVHKRKR